MPKWHAKMAVTRFWPIFAQKNFPIYTRFQTSPKFFQSPTARERAPPMWGGSRKMPLPPLERGAVPPVRGTTPPDGGGSPPRWGGMTKNERIFAQIFGPIYMRVKTSPELFRRDLKLVRTAAKLVRNFFDTRPPRCMRMTKLVRSILCFLWKKHFFLDRFSFPGSCRLSSRSSTSPRKCTRLPPVISTTFPNNHLSVHLVFENSGNKRRLFSAFFPLFCSAESFSPEFIQQMLSIPG